MIKCCDGQTPIPRQTCVLMNKGPVLGINMDFILGTDY